MMMNKVKKYSIIIICFFYVCCIIPKWAFAQGDYEIQVYGAEIASKTFMVELHSNSTNQGSRVNENGIVPTHRLLHETIELSYGYNDWCQTAFYLFNALGDDGRSAIVGFHIRQMIASPLVWHLPIGLGLSTEYGYMNSGYTTDPISLEIRPIIDRRWNFLYLSLNPVFDLSFQGQNKNKGLEFSPSIKFSFRISKKVEIGTEYYGGLGSLNHFYPSNLQQHQCFFVADIDFNENWEFNAGYGYSFTQASDNGVFKLILGRSFKAKKRI